MELSAEELGAVYSALKITDAVITDALGLDINDTNVILLTKDGVLRVREAKLELSVIMAEPQRWYKLVQKFEVELSLEGL